MKITLSKSRKIDRKQVIELYQKNQWSSARKPNELMKALKNSHTLITAWDGKKLVGLGNSLSDGYMVVYYPHLLILPEYQGKGIGKMIMKKFQEKYSKFHQQILTADGKAIKFYSKCGFEKAGSCLAMWIYKGHDHD